LHGDHYEIEGLDPVKANANVATAVNAEKFFQLVNARLKGK
jgi:hypothetical protein